MTFKTAQAYILCALFVAGIAQYNDYGTNNCNESFINDSKFINDTWIRSLNSSMAFGLFWSCDEDQNNYCFLQILSPIISLNHSNRYRQLCKESDAKIQTPSASAICSTIGANVSALVMLPYPGLEVSNDAIWYMLSENYNNSKFDVTCKIGTEGNFTSQCDSVKQSLEVVINCKKCYQWDPARCGFSTYELHRKPNSPGATFPTPASSASTSVTTTKSSSILATSSTNTYSGSTSSYPGSSQMSNFPFSDAHTDDDSKLALGLGLGLGLGIPLLIAIIIIIVLCIQLSISKREKRSKSDAYSSISPNSGNSSPNGATHEPQLSADYSSISPNSTINKSTFNRKTLYAPSSTYDQLYGNGNGNYASIPPSSGTTPSPQQKQPAPSVLYAIVNKVKPKRNSLKNSRTLANPNDDVVIVDNDLYTADSVVNK